MKLILLAALSIVFGPKTVLAHDLAARLCETRLNLELISKNKLGYLPEFRTETAKPFSSEPGVQRIIITAKHPRFSTDLAFLDYQIFDGGQTIEVEKVDVLNSNNFRKGLSNLLFAQMIAREPKAVRIRATLADVNLRALTGALQPGQDCLQAFIKTPLYQTAIHFEFTKISGNCNPATNEYNFVMEH